MSKKPLDVKTIKERINDKFDGKYEFVNFKTYNNAKQKEEIKCNSCGEIFITSITSLLFENHKEYCPKCKKNKKHVEFVKKVRQETNNEYIVLSKYNTCKKKVLFRHNIDNCMNEFWMTPDGFLNGGCRCPKCMIKQRANKLFLSDEEFIKRINKIHGEHVTLLGKYTGYDGKIKIRHEDCGREFDMLCGDLLQGKSCRYCAGKLLKTTEQFKNELYDLYGNEYSLIGEYKNAKTKVHIRHNVCGYEWDVIPGSIIKRRTCPCCNKSCGEKELENFAIHNRLNYKTQETFNGCFRNDFLKFDMSIYDDNNELLCLVEFDGSTHFEISRFGNISEKQAILNLQDQKERDKIKDDFCKTNHIMLLRLSNIDTLCNELKNYLYDNFNIVTEIPNEYHYNKMKTPAIKFLEMIEKLPNGLYPKTYFSNELLTDGQKLSATCLNKEVVKKYMIDNSVINHPLYIEINNNVDDYDKYIEIGNRYNFNFEVFKNIKNLYHLPNGKYSKVEVGYKNKAIIKCDTYMFFNRFIEKQNITFTCQNLYKNAREAA